nr:hypothetical protein [Tanacetum cinerariifolium]
MLVVMPFDNLKFSDNDDSTFGVDISSRLHVDRKSIELLTFAPPMRDSSESIFTIADWCLTPHCVRLIQDNIMLIQELLMGYNRKNRGKRMAFKIDIQKAYDTLNRNFLEEALKQKSVEVINDSLEEFSSSSGLLPNPSKSIVFFGNVGNDEREEILSIMSFSVALSQSDIWYFGVPLIIKRLGIKQLYWSSMFLLLTSVVKEINRLLKGFIWVQDELKCSKAKIAWSEVCKPKVDGGLGQHRTTMPDHRSTVADHRSTVTDHGGHRRSTVAVNDGRRWRTTVDHRSTVVDRPVNVGSWAGSGSGLGRVWIGSGPGLDRVQVGCSTWPTQRVPRGTS